MVKKELTSDGLQPPTAPFWTRQAAARGHGLGRAMGEAVHCPADELPGCCPNPIGYLGLKRRAMWDYWQVGVTVTRSYAGKGVVRYAR